MVIEKVWNNTFGTNLWQQESISHKERKKTIGRIIVFILTISLFSTNLLLTSCHPVHYDRFLAIKELPMNTGSIRHDGFYYDLSEPDHEENEDSVYIRLRAMHFLEDGTHIYDVFFMKSLVLDSVNRKKVFREYVQHNAKTSTILAEERMRPEIQRYAGIYRFEKSQYRIICLFKMPQIHKYDEQVGIINDNILEVRPAGKEYMHRKDLIQKYTFYKY